MQLIVDLDNALHRMPFAAGGLKPRQTPVGWKGICDEKCLDRRTFVGGIQTVTVLPGTFLPLYGHDPESLTGPNAWLGLAGVQVQATESVYARLFANAGRAFGDDDALVDASGVLAGVGLDLSMRTPVGPLTLSFGTNAVDRLPDVGVRVGHVF